MQETWVRFLGQEDPLKKGMTTHSTISAWEIPWTEEPDGPQRGCKESDMTERLTLSRDNLCLFKQMCTSILIPPFAQIAAYCDLNLAALPICIGAHSISICKVVPHPVHVSVSVGWILRSQTSGIDLVVLIVQSCLILCNPTDCSLPGSYVHGDSPGKNTGVGCHALLQGVFPTQGSNPGLPCCRQILYHLHHQKRSPLYNK